MQDISDNARAGLESYSAAPVMILRLTIEDTDYYFAPSQEGCAYMISGVLLGCGALEEKVGADLVSGYESVKIGLSDLDKTFLGLLSGGVLEGAAAVMLQSFNGLVAGEEFTVFSGIVKENSEWHERRLELRLEGYESIFNKKQLLRQASREIFPGILPDDEGRTLPLCFGRPREVKAVRVKAVPKTTLVTKLGSNETEFYVADASSFPACEITLNVGYERITGSFSGNRFTVTDRGMEVDSGNFTGRTGNVTVVKVSGLSGGAGGRYAGLYIKLINGSFTSQVRIIDSAADGVLYLQSTFIDEGGFYYQPLETDVARIYSKAVMQYPGAKVSLADESEYYLVNDGPVDSVLLVEGKTKNGLVRIPQSRYEVIVSDEELFPDLGRPAALIKLYSLPTQINSADYNLAAFTSDDIYVTLVAEDVEGNPVDIIRSLLVTEGGIAEALLDEDSFTDARVECAEISMSFALTSGRTVAALLSDLCFQARLSLLWQRGKFYLHPLHDGIGASLRTLSSDEIISLTASDEPVADPIDGIEVSYSGGTVCLYRDNSVRSNVKKLDLWAYESYQQVRAQAEWWLRRLSNPWRRVRVQTYLPAADLERYDVLELAVADELGSRVTGVVQSFRRHTLGGADDMEICELELIAPVWQGCASSCESSCEAGSCESGGCEMSCTSGCELACQSACQTAVEPVSDFIIYGCRTTCQLSCRASTEEGCSSGGCETSCESGCEVSCEGVAFETTCQSDCQTADEAATDEPEEKDYLLATVTIPPSSLGGSVTLSVVDTAEEIEAVDISDLRPVTGDTCAVIKSESGTWYIMGAGREAKFVKVQADLGEGSYTVIESNGSQSWGSSFTASVPV